MAKRKLNQVVAVVGDQKKLADKTITDAYQTLQKGDLFSGMSRKYETLLDEDKVGKPPEMKNPQQSVRQLYKAVEPVLVKAWDSVATQDYANCAAVADVVVDGEVLLTGVPVTHLMFLEHKLKDLQTFIEKMPVRDGAEAWTFNEATNSHETGVLQKDSTRKVLKPIVLFPATVEHPAQTQLITEDQVVGRWHEKRFSTAIGAKDKETMLGRVVKLAEAVKEAREEANSIHTEERKVAGKLLDFVFADVLK